MRDSRINRLFVGTILWAYLVTGALSSRSLLGQELFFKLDSSLSVQNERSIDLDERPYWTSHKHLTSPEQFSSDHILSAAEPGSALSLLNSLLKSGRRIFRHLHFSFHPTPFAHLRVHSLNARFELSS